MSEKTDHSPDGALRLPRQTTPTWEIELLISGATVFGLIQLPAQVESGLLLIINRVAQDLATLLIPMSIYIQSVLMILIGTFVLHLCLRAYWVALVGLNSVLPGGVKWESFKKTGPYQLAASKRGRESMSDLIENADNRASQLFGVGVGLALALIVPMALVFVGIIMALLVRLLPGGDQVPAGVPGAILIGVVFLPWMMAVMVDAAFGARLPPTSRSGRLLRALLGFYTRLGLGRASNLPIALYVSHSKGHRGNIIISIASVLIAIAVSMQVISRISDWTPDDLDGLPAFSTESEDIVLPRFYASMRARDPSLRPMPYIPDTIVRGPYLKLFVPYRVSRYNAALARLCEAPTPDQRSSRVALDCYAKLHDVRIDNVVISDLRFDAAEDPISGQRGLLAMIPMGMISAGRHELTLQPIPRDIDIDGAVTTTKPAPLPYRIPFWR